MTDTILVVVAVGAVCLFWTYLRAITKGMDDIWRMLESIRDTLAARDAARR